MKLWFWPGLLLVIITLVGLTLLGGGVAAAQAPDPTPIVPPGRTDLEGLPELSGAHHPRSSRLEQSITSLDASTTDQFGYSRIDNDTYSWEDVTSGQLVQFSNADDSYSGPINLGFDFKFYENTYSQVYISTNGLLTFGTGGSHPRNETIPLDTDPNNLIAPFWDDLAVGDINSGEVYYALKSGPSGAYVVIQWNEVTRRVGGGGLLTFEVLLYENGNIKFQYKTLDGEIDEATVGIEDADGIDGLLYVYNAIGLSPGQAIKFTRPPAEARVKLLSTYESGFAIAGKASFSLEIRNTGEVGSDTYDLTTSSNNSGWKVRLYDQWGVTKLADSDLDSVIDTGAISQGDSRTITVQLEPSSENVGDAVQVVITARSSKNTSKSAQAKIASAIPTSFAQAYADSATGIRLDLIWQPGVQSAKASDWFSGSTLALAQTPQDNYVYAWEKNGSKLVNGIPQLYSDIEYTLVTRFGHISKSAQKLTDNESGAQSVTDRSPTVAALPNGRIGLVWVRSILNQEYKTNSNVYFAVLNADGSVLSPPERVTSNDQWRGSNDYDVPLYFSPRIAATSDNRFMLAWVDQRQVSSEADAVTSDIGTAVMDANGGTIAPPATLTSSTVGGSRYFDPSLAPLSNARLFIAFSESDASGSSSTILFAVLNSSNDTLKSATGITGSAGWGPDAVQLKSGKIVLVWTNGMNDDVSFIVLSGSNYSVSVGPTDLSTPNLRQSDYVSVTTDGEGRAILTWMDFMWNHYLYYTLIDDGGDQITPPMVILTGQSTDPLILTSYAGQGNAPYEGSFQTFIPLVKR